MDRVGWERIAPSLVGSWVGEARPSGEAFVADLCCGQQNWLGLYRLAPWVLRAWQFGQRVIPHPPANCSQAATIAVTIIAGPLNYLGVNPKISCHRLPQPSK